MRRLVIVFATMILAAAMCPAQEPRLSGEWKLNQAKSFLAGDHPPANYVLVLHLKIEAGSLAQAITAENAGDAMYGLPRSKSSLDVPVDGKPHDVTRPGFMPGMPDTHVSVSAEWQGDTLLIRESGVVFGGLSRRQGRYFLSGDGAQLIELVESHSTFGDSEQRLVFDKQG